LTSFTSFSDIQGGLAKGEFTVVDLVNFYLRNILENQHLGAFLEVFEAEALDKAQFIDHKIKSGSAGKLAGMVLGIKDVFCYKDHALTGGSAILKGFTSLFTATAIQRLIDEDAIIIGRQNCDEFAMGSSNENSAFGPVLNADDPTKVPGGSSGGSAVAVQANMCFASIASDTGGSIRQPAAFCGLVGLKGTYSRVSRNGLLAYGSSFDCIGPICQKVEDAALLLEIMAGPDPMDSTCSKKETESYSKAIKGDKKYKVAYWDQILTSPVVQKEIKESCKDLIDKALDAGHEVVPIPLPYLEYVLPTYYILTTSEASSNLSRYDGMHFGHRTSDSANLEATYKKSRSEGFGPEVQRRILLGTLALSSDYYDAYYTKAQKVRRLIQDSAFAVFKDFDFLLMPTTPGTAFPLGAKTTDPLEMYFADIFTVWCNLAGVPAINVPYGRDKSGMAIGLQIHAGPFKEMDMLDFAAFMEKSNPVTI
jgi:aspartyl-tRNA(Asn)/glutamyl-tRNA(Gln) amidotransferase subunit A